MKKENLTLGFIGTIITFILILATFAVALPLIVFGAEAYSNPDIIQLNASATPINQTHLNITIYIVYDGSVPLKNFSIKINDTWHSIGTLKRGKTIFSLILEAKPVTISEYAFSIGGLYKVELGVESGGTT